LICCHSLSDTDVNDPGKDYGYVLPVRLITEIGISRYAEIVDAGVRASLKTPMRMRNVDGYSGAIERLVAQYNDCRAFITPISPTARLHTAWEIALAHAANLLQERLGSELDARFQAAEWEKPMAHSTAKCNGERLGVEENLTRSSVAEYPSGARVEFILDPLNIGIGHDREI
jgi:hypothetical protein